MSERKGLIAAIFARLSRPRTDAFLIWNQRALNNLFFYEKTGDLTALNESITSSRHFLAVTPLGHPDRAAAQCNLGLVLRALFERTGETAAIEEAVELFRDAAAITTDTPVLPDGPERSAMSFHLGAALLLLFKQTGELSAITEAVAAARFSVTAASSDRPDRGARFNGLAMVLLELFRISGDLALINEAATAGRAAVAATPPDDLNYGTHLNTLGVILQKLFRASGDLSSINEAATVGRAAVAATSPEDAVYGGMLSNLGITLRLLSGQSDDFEALIEAIEVGRAAVMATPSDDPDHADYLSNLGNSLQTMFARTGEFGYLTEAIEVGRAAVTAFNAFPNHPGRPSILSNLGGFLRVLFDWTGQTEALTEAVAMMRDAVYATSSDSPEYGKFLANLSSALQALHVRTGNSEVLVEAIKVGHVSIVFTPVDHPERAMRLSVLGGVLQLSFIRTGDVELLKEAISVGREVISLARDDRYKYLSNLGVCLMMLFMKTGQLSTLTEAVQIIRQAAAAASPGDPDRAQISVILGDALQELYEKTKNVDHLVEARKCFSEAADQVATPVRIQMAANRGLAKTAMWAGDSRGALAAYEKVIAFLPQMTPRRLRQTDRQYGLGETAGLAAEAAAAAIAAGRPEYAVELLEQTRGVLLGETMAAHGDFIELQTRSPHLAARFVQLRDALDAAEHTGFAPSDTGGLALSTQERWPLGDPHRQESRSGPEASIRQVAAERQRLSQEWDQLLAQIRAVPGLKQFLLPPPISQLQRQASGGPITMVNISPYRCDALTLTDDPDHPVRLTELPGVTHDVVLDQVARFFSATLSVDKGPLGERRAAQQQIQAVLSWLWDEIAAPVLQDLGFTDRPEDDQNWPRLWWCPVGDATLLPLHAAGHHAEGHGAEPPRTLLDRVIPSYTPTIRALGYGRQAHLSTSSPGADDGTRSALIVALPETPGAPALPGAHAEATRLAQLLPGSLTLAGHHATHDAVLAALPKYPLVHLACHGLTNWGISSESMLLLHDHAIQPLTVAVISRLRIPKAHLAYLSACSTTTTGDPRLVDEAVHITGAFQLAGYQHVIGTLWPIGDAAAVRIAGEVYTHLTNDGTKPPHTDQAALALHHAIRRLRDDHRSNPAMWAAHIHVGI
ncbi:CHAT domain-containing protein [Streptosporangium sp. NPDC023825]|uniref:CHAT domain-containing protein n=1 Tax=Streptosporangium sp. NPDC023825 TaxID=3154909 RepID=UPI0034181502